MKATPLNPYVMVADLLPLLRARLRAVTAAIAALETAYQADLATQAKEAAR